MRKHLVSTWISLAQDQELSYHVRKNAASIAEHCGMNYSNFPSLEGIPIPYEKIMTILDFFDEKIYFGSVVFTCWACIGRSGTIAACVLIRFGSYEPEEAMEVVKKTRGVVLAQIHHDNIWDFYQKWKNRTH